MLTLWTATVEQTITEDMPAAPDEVRALFIDLDNITVFHPLVVSVERLSCKEDLGHKRMTYRVRDRIPMGPVSLPISYWACTEFTSGGEVRTQARQFPNVRLEGLVSFEADEQGTRLTEQLSITAPRLILPLVRRETVTAHTEMLAGIRNHFESR